MTDDEHCCGPTALTAITLSRHHRTAGFTYAHDPTPQIDVTEHRQQSEIPVRHSR
jgi:hypothetical protein